MLLTPAQMDLLLFLPGVDALHVYVRAWALGCFQSYHYPNLSEGADRVGGQLRGDTECPFSGVTKFGRVWRKVPESDARSVAALFTSAQLSPVWLVTRFPMQNLCWD